MLLAMTRRWHGFWMPEGPPHGLAAFRILSGVYWLVTFVAMGPYVPLYFSSDGAFFGLYTYQEQPAEGLSALLAFISQPVPPMGAWIVYALTLTTIVAFTIGYRARAALTLFLGLLFYYWLVYWHLHDTSYHRLLIIIAFLLAISPCDNVFSVRQTSKHRTLQKVPLWTQRLICFQIAFVYFGTGAFKLTADAWTEGNALASSLMGAYSTPLGFAALRIGEGTPIFGVLGWSVILFELLAPFALFFRRTRLITMVIGLSFHISIGLMLNIWPFLIVPLTYVLFFDPADVQRCLERLIRLYPGRLQERHA